MFIAGSLFFAYKCILKIATILDMHSLICLSVRCLMILSGILRIKCTILSLILNYLNIIYVGKK